jgi:uncharacterized protein YjiS (DUF1127 family)
MEDEEVENFEARRDNGELFSNRCYSASGAGTWDPYVTCNGVSYPKDDSTNASPWTIITGPYNGALVQPTTTGTVANISNYAGLAGMDIDGLASAAYGANHTEISAAIAEQATQSMVSLLEAPKTLRMLRDAVRFLRKPLAEAQRDLGLTRRQLREPGGRAAAFDRANNAWLAGRYGWRPFVYDVIQHVEALGSSSRKRESVRKRFTEGTGTYSSSSAIGGFHYPGLGLSYSYESTWSADWTVSGGQTADFYSGLTEGTLGSLFKYGALNPLTTAWELVPYSFVWDWFVNLGDMLGAMEAFAFAEERIGWTTVKCTLHYTRENYQIAVASHLKWGYYYIFTEVVPPSHWNEEAVIKYRLPVESFLPMIGLRNRLNATKVVDLFSLLYAALRR